MCSCTHCSRIWPRECNAYFRERFHQSSCLLAQCSCVPWVQDLNDSMTAHLRLHFSNEEASDEHVSCWHIQPLGFTHQRHLNCQTPSSIYLMVQSCSSLPLTRPSCLGNSIGIPEVSQSLIGRARFAAEQCKGYKLLKP